MKKRCSWLLVLVFGLVFVIYYGYAAEKLLSETKSASGGSEAKSRIESPRETASGGGPVGYWNFDKGEGEVVEDNSGNKSDGEIVGGVEWVKGKAGKALEFNGEDASVTIYSEIIGAEEQLTIEVWVKPFDQIAGAHNYHKDIIRSQCFGDGKWSISTDVEFNTSNKLSMHVAWITGGDDWWAPPEAQVLKDEWNHIVLTLDRTTGKSIFYRNGQKFAAATHTVGEKPITTGFSIGSNCGGPFKGIIDEVKIYNRVLSPEEIKASYLKSK